MVDKLIVPVILGINFLQMNGLVLDFTTTPMGVHCSSEKFTILPHKERNILVELQPVYKEIPQNEAKVCPNSAGEEPTADTIVRYQDLVPQQGIIFLHVLNN